MAFEFSLKVNADGSMDGSYPDGDKPALPTELLTLSDITYAGAFRLQTGTFGADNLADYTEKCIIGMNKSTGNLLVTGSGESNTKTIGEFDIPSLSTSSTLTDLSIGNNTQNFVNILDNIPSSSSDGDDVNGKTIYGIYEKSGKIVIHYARYYDNFPYINEVVAVHEDSSDLTTTSNIKGHFKYDNEQHSCGWISDVPAAWQTDLGEPNISGWCPGTSRGILGRLPVGPTAFGIDVDDLLSPVPANGTTITTATFMDFPYPNGLGTEVPANIDDEIEEDCAGRIFNLATEINYGFIVPGTSTYLCFGHQAGFASNLKYKERNDTSQTDWGDYDAVDPADYRNIYMMFDVNDLVDAKNGVINEYDIVPYEWGAFTPQFGGTPAAGIKKISGATYDSTTGRLYMAIIYADDSQAGLGDLPVIEAYTFSV